ncbi:indole-3-glycerol phosphate synthase TrpC [Chitinophagaceae bacterium LB-8]|uniref:indole-3-glycerol-phosphate synthase n=2 Tax=Paraflavisolibacter caeni TaxID=2982496 RepID=A0A9X2XNR1_9BACT|nr:indole-3-glycerol phosphate synthase TrpC [Paraflavisolibacter caeni]
MNILDKIIAQKRIEVAQRKAEVTIAELEKGPFFKSETYSLKAALLDNTKTGIIAEYKRKSPSKGIINDKATIEEVTMAYATYGASGISVLTDHEFFGGSLADLQKAAIINKIPLLRKDFMIDEYQLLEAKAYGASVILLIAANLSVGEVKSLASAAKNLGLEVLLEIHNEQELEHICDEVDLVGVNNRNLKTFEVSLDTSVQLSNLIPLDKLKISESGIHKVEDIHYLEQYGFKGFLIGENFMKQEVPGEAFRSFAEELKNYKVSKTS